MKWFAIGCASLCQIALSACSTATKTETIRLTPPSEMTTPCRLHLPPRPFPGEAVNELGAEVAIAYKLAYEQCAAKVDQIRRWYEME